MYSKGQRRCVIFSYSFFVLKYNVLKIKCVCVWGVGGVLYGLNWVLVLDFCYVLIVKVFELNYYNMLLKYRLNIVINFMLLLIYIIIIYFIFGLKIVINLWVLL